MGKRTGLVVFANNGGIGIQTKRLYEMLKPDKVMIVDSTGFSKNKQFHPEWYPEDSMITKGFPKNYHINEWLYGVDSVLFVENPYNFYFIHACRERGIKTIVQTNYEFCENIFASWLPVPDLFLMPSYWKLNEMKERFGDDKVYLLPPPIEPEEFEEARILNFKKKGRPRFLHIIGTLAAGDRNGTLDLLKAIPLTTKNYELVIHSQHKLPEEYIIDDKRVTYRIGNIDKNSDLFLNFDGFILPRRYGGLSLGTNEALMSGIPVMMPDISPNNRLLPGRWLVRAKVTHKLQTRVLLDVYSVSIEELAKKIDKWACLPPSKSFAFNLAKKNFSPEFIERKYKTVLNK